MRILLLGRKSETRAPQSTPPWDLEKKNEVLYLGCFLSRRDILSLEDNTTNDRNSHCLTI